MPEKKISHNVKGEIAEENDAIIVVIGEGPYAETDGDRGKNSVAISDKLTDKAKVTLCSASAKIFPKVKLPSGVVNAK